MSGSKNSGLVKKTKKRVKPAVTQETAKVSTTILKRPVSLRTKSSVAAEPEAAVSGHTVLSIGDSTASKTEEKEEEMSMESFEMIRRARSGEIELPETLDNLEEYEGMAEEDKEEVISEMNLDNTLRSENGYISPQGFRLMLCTNHDYTTPYNPVTLVVADSYENGISMLSNQLKRLELNPQRNMQLTDMPLAAPGAAIMSIGVTGIGLDRSKVPEERPILYHGKSMYEWKDLRYYYCTNHTSGPTLPPVSIMFAGSESEAFQYLQNALEKIGARLNDSAQIFEVKTASPVVKFLVPGV